MRSEEFRALLTSLVEAATAGKINDTARLASAVESAFRDATATRLDIPAAFHTCRDDWRDAIATAVAGSQASPEALRSFDRAYSQLSSALCQQIPPVRPRAEVEERARSVLLAASENPGEISSGSLSTREARVSAVVNQIAKAVEQSAAGEVVHVDRLLGRAAELAWFCSSMPYDCVANAQRWEAVISTMRHNHEAQRVFDTVKGIRREDMFFTGRLAKRPHLAALGVHPDVWIDDNPHWVDGDIT